MSAVAGNGTVTDGEEMKTYWRYHPKPQACDKCQAMKGLWFEKKPGPVHPNCKCEIEEFKAIKVTGRSEAMIVPPDVDIAANIAEARRVAKECEAKAQKITALSSGHYAEKQIAFLLKCWWIYDKFQSGADYDFKKGGTHPEYEDFGNYHYGLYTKAMGINVTLAQAAAGAWQLKQGTSEWTNPEFIKNWFDDPRDNRRIREGQQYPLD
ncbi:polymorphic toxin type 44 domain-containing protein [uncultured Pseudodesulfovibrio sp.]|uniref:polymorphic toxin type 44 domain-containing protein n=1 Tax=uncultured Pseudodesulfovibrio sp. TaxID=2035858 RepID=UPI0029C8E20A|nr:polymorphic toxin type 44 domain-containing protein [uncultured Pseudodesulfovibrio sp.]